MDVNQAAHANTGRGHRENVIRWRNRDEEKQEASESDIREAWIQSAMVVGMNGSVTAQFAAEFFGRCEVPFSASVPKCAQGVFVFSFTNCGNAEIGGVDESI